MIKVTIFSTKGARKSTLETTATTWGALKSQMKDADIPVDGMKAILGETQMTLESAKAILPDFNFTLFLNPVKVKNGSDSEDMTYVECRKFIQEARNTADGKEFFGNYTRLSTTSMRSLINDYVASKSGVCVSCDQEEVKDIKDVVTSAMDSLSKIKEYLDTHELVSITESVDALKEMWADIESNL